MIFVAKSVFCQIVNEKIAPPGDIYPLKFPSKTNNSSKTNRWGPVNDQNRAPVSVISADHYSQNIGFFCKKELQLEKLTRVPFKFRLGTVQYCDWMEGKKGAGILPVH